MSNKIKYYIPIIGICFVFINTFQSQEVRILTKPKHFWCTAIIHGVTLALFILYILTK